LSVQILEIAQKIIQVTIKINVYKVLPKKCCNGHCMDIDEEDEHGRPGKEMEKNWRFKVQLEKDRDGSATQRVVEKSGP